jgi:hypothetical protein
MKISSNITVEIGGRQRIALSLAEARKLIVNLSNFIEDNRIMQGRNNPGARALHMYAARRKKIPGISEAKMNEIVKHVERELSETPRTLSNLLNGISYIPNHLPMIRDRIEKEPYISRKIIGKRTYYFLKDAQNTKSRRLNLAAAVAR